MTEIIKQIEEEIKNDKHKSLVFKAGMKHILSLLTAYEKERCCANCKFRIEYEDYTSRCLMLNVSALKKDFYCNSFKSK